MAPFLKDCRPVHFRARWTAFVGPRGLGWEKRKQPMNTQQLEIGLTCHRLNDAKRRRQLRATRARWWFGRMRDAVESTAEWTPPIRRQAESCPGSLSRQ